MPEPQASTPPTRIVDSLRFIGPGLILTAGIVGTGELVVTPSVAAQNGFALLWLIIIGCMVKVFVQVELGRYAVVTGITTLRALDQIPGPRFRVGWMLWVWVPVFVAMISVIGGMLGGIGELLHLTGINLDVRIITAVLGVSLAAILAAGRYRLVERFSIALVVLFTVSTIFALGALQLTEFRVTAANIIEGLEFKLPEDFSVAFAALGIIGVGAAELIYYPYWCLEKGYARRVGPRDDGWLARANGWLRVMRVDAFASMIIYTGATVAFFLLGAAVLHSQSLVVSNDKMVETLARMYLESFGAFGWWIFVVGAFATLYSTAFAATASNSRLMVDALSLFGFMKEPVDDEAKAWRIKLFGVLLPVYATVLYLVWPNPYSLIMISGIGQALLLPFLAGAAIYFRYKKLDPELRPGRLWTAFLWLSAISLTAAGFWQLVDRLR